MEEPKSNANAEDEFLRLLEEEKAEKEAQDKDLKGLKKQNASKLQRSGFIVAGALAVALIGFFVVYDPFTGAIRFGESGSPTVERTETINADAKSDPMAWAKETGSIFPVKTKPWEERYFADQKEAEITSGLNEHFHNAEFMQFAASLPMESAGFTSDDSKEEIDGLPNPMYSYWTQESFSRETSMIVNRLLNPAFGGWNKLQFNQETSSEDSLDLFRDIFTTQWLEANDSSALPIYADLTGTTYPEVDRLLSIEEGARWIGTVTGSTTTSTFVPEDGNYVVNLVVNVKYQAWTKDKESLEKNGVLTLELVANANNKYSTSTSNKVLINSASLVVN